MNGEDLKKAPKLFAENVNTGHSAEFFVVAVQSGQQAQVYTFTPQHAKRLAQKLQFEIGEYEKKHGEITAEWSPNVVSPVQRANPPQEGS